MTNYIKEGVAIYNEKKDCWICRYSGEELYPQQISFNTATFLCLAKGQYIVCVNCPLNQEGKNDEKPTKKEGGGAPPGHDNPDVDSTLAGDILTGLF